MSEKISVVMPAYNQGIYIKEALDSILKQDISDWKLYIVNDGSTDNTKELVQPYISDKIVYFEKENGGTGSALNYGFDKSEGIYHAYVSSDNVYFSNYLRELTQILDTMSNVMFVYSDFQFINDKGVPGQKIIRPKYTKNSLLYGCPIGLCFMWRASVYKEIGGFDTKFTAQDYDFALKIEDKYDLYHIPVMLGYYRDHAQTVSHVKGFDDTPVVVANAKRRRGLIK